ncbi:MAG: hypothetical protein MUF85_01520, partial [Patescibacteria group bacterium]|nr:hypothetical protein [Patescibacteria group bacterium]
MRKFLPILLATLWISFSEFLRNNLLLKSYWVEHYNNLGLVFPEKPINGLLWGIWSLLFAVAIFFIASKYSTIHATFISWLVGFVMMWVVIGNLQVLPYEILWFAIPLSIIETFFAVLIIKKFHYS